MNVRITNSSNEILRVILEPWATEYEVAPQDYIEFRPENIVPEQASFHIEHKPAVVVVYPEWEHASVSVYGSSGVQFF
jgi:hypothetical protein